jgi:hypothetical protein
MVDCRGREYIFFKKTSDPATSKSILVVAQSFLRVRLGSGLARHTLPGHSVW